MSPSPPSKPLLPAWDEQPIITIDELREIAVEMDGWYWVIHPNPSFDGQVGCLEFVNGKAAFSPEKIYEDASDGAKDWFQSDGDDGVLPLRTVPLWVLLWCWAKNGFVVREMQGGKDEWTEFHETPP